MPRGGCDRVLTPGAVARAAATLYADAAPRARVLARLRPWICPFERLVGLVPEGARVLDVGCGNGLLLGLLASEGRIASGIGLDADARAIIAAERMRARLPDPARLEFRCQDAHAEWPAGPFDVVSLVDVLHHVALVTNDMKKTVAFYRDVLGGEVVMAHRMPRPGNERHYFISVTPQAVFAFFEFPDAELPTHKGATLPPPASRYPAGGRSTTSPSSRRARKRSSSGIGGWARRGWTT